MDVKNKEKQILRVGHSPDADDAFMFHAISNGAVQLNSFEIEHVIEDIQSLNQRALKSDLDVTALSAAVYPEVADRYWILSCGASVGRNYGPIVVAEQDWSAVDLKKKRIAVPGEKTTAFLLLTIFLEDFEPVFMDFNEVIPAVLAKKVDAGLVIHEGQINFGSYHLYRCMDLGALWFNQYQLPIPLGLDVVKKDLGWDCALEIHKILYESIRYARSHEKEALDYASKFGRGVEGEILKEFVEMYVNEDTLDLGREGKQALELLFKLGREKGFYSTAIPELKIVYP